MSKLIVGLGNPGDIYKNNRHNIGFKIIDSIAKKNNINLDKQGHKGVYGSIMVGSEKVILAKPLTYMNLSGDFVSSFANYYNVSTDDIIIIHDDIDTKLGEIRIRTSGSSGGQNGIKDIISKLGTESFKRIKIGIGPKNPKIDLSSFVLANFNQDEMNKLSKVINVVVEMMMNIDKVEFSNLHSYVMAGKK